MRVYLGRDPVTGHPRQLSRTVHAGPATKRGQPPKAVRLAAAELETEAAAGKLGGTNASVSVLLDHYFEQLDRKQLSPTTLSAYRRYARLHITPAIGAKPVKDVTAWDLDRLYAGLTGKSPSTIRQCHAILSGAFGQAVKWGWCPTNVAKMASPPTVRQAKVVAPTVEEVRQLVAAAEERNPTMGALIMLAALTGARRGELCALRWSDVDLDAGTVRIARSLIDLPGRVEEKSTKTHAERVLALGDAGVALLKLHRTTIDERARIGEATIAPDAYIFSDNLNCATPIRPDSVTGFFTRLRDDLKMPHVHFHSLRHFTATQMAARGDISVRTLAGRLGHADPSVSLKVYSAFFPASDAEAAGHLGEILSPKNG